MRRFLSLLILAAIFTLQALAQQGEPVRGIVQSITEGSDSTIIIDIAPDLLRAVTPAPKVEKPRAERPKKDVREKPTGPKRMQGFRIQIFGDGRNQATLQTRARVRTSQVLAKFPAFGHQVYTVSKAPNLYTRIGNFATRGEAAAALSKLQRAFPAFAGEMRIISCEVVINR